MHRSIVILFFYVFSQCALADCPESIQIISKGQVANCDGALLSPEALKKADEAIQDSKYYKALTERLYQRQELTSKEIDILDKRLKLYMDQSQVLASQLTSKQNEDKWQKVIYFSLGVVATGISVYAASQVIR